MYCQTTTPGFYRSAKSGKITITTDHRLILTVMNLSWGFTHELMFKRTDRCCLQFQQGMRTQPLLERKLESWWNYQRVRSCKRKIDCKDTMDQKPIDKQNKMLKLKLTRFQNLLCCESFSYGRRFVVSSCAAHKISVCPYNLCVVSYNFRWALTKITEMKNI
jgi:hypothetical protein